jgi:hypothetical protein
MRPACANRFAHCIRRLSCNTVPAALPSHQPSSIRHCAARAAAAVLRTPPPAAATSPGLAAAAAAAASPLPRRRASTMAAAKTKLSQGELTQQCLIRAPAPIVDVGVNLADDCFDKVGGLHAWLRFALVVVVCMVVVYITMPPRLPLLQARRRTKPCSHPSPPPPHPQPQPQPQLNPNKHHQNRTATRCCSAPPTPASPPSSPPAAL